MYSGGYRLKMTKDHINFHISSNQLSVQEYAIREFEDDNRIQFILKNNSGDQYRIKEISIKLFNSGNEFMGHENQSLFLDDKIKKHDEKMFEFDIVTFNNIHSADISIKCERWFNIDNFIIGTVYTIMIFVIAFIMKDISF